MDTLTHDLRYAVRSLAKSPGFTLIAVLCLALGIGANSTMFGVIDSLFLRPPAVVQDPGRVVRLYVTRRSGNIRSTEGAYFAYPDYTDLRDGTHAFSGLAMTQAIHVSFGRGADAQQLDGMLASAGYFSTLGVRPVIGRFFVSAEDSTPGAHPVAVLSYAFWQRQFAGDRGVLGRVITLNGQPFTVIGVAPQHFNSIDLKPIDLWAPLMMQAQLGGFGNLTHTCGCYPIFARLRPEMTREQAGADASATLRHADESIEALDHDPRVTLGPINAAMGPRRSQPATMALWLLIVTGVVLLIACANVANLLLARGTAREREIAIRTALGASRWRIVRQLLMESVTLALFAGALCVLVASWGIHWVWASIPVRMPFYITWGIDQRALAFTFVISLATGVLFGMLPALHASRTNVQSTLKTGGRGSTAGAAHLRTRGALVAGQFALSLVLLIGATLLIRSFLATTAVDVGFDAAHVLTMQLHFTGDRYANAGRRTAFVDQVLQRIEAIPGVQSAAATSYVPLFGVATMSRFQLEGRPVVPNEAPRALYRPVTAHYLDALHVPLVRGRAFTERETSDAANDVVLVSETLAERYYPNENPLGHRLRVAADSSGAWLTIVGVVKDIKQRWIGERPEPQIYLPYAHAAAPTTTVMVRTAADPAQATSAVRQAVHEVDPTIALFDVQPMRAIVDLSFWKSRLYGAMFGAYAAIALVLAVGVYGMMAYAVSRRVHEIGVRMALGAQPRDVLRLVVGRGLAATLVGVVLGLAGAFAVTRLLAGLLFGVTSTDPVTFIGIPVLLTGVALLASYLPARRATRVDPVVALRSE